MRENHYTDAVMSSTGVSKISFTIVYWTVYSGADQRKHQSSSSPIFVWGIHRWTTNSPHKRPLTWKMFPIDDVSICWVFHGRQLDRRLQLLLHLVVEEDYPGPVRWKIGCNLNNNILLGTQTPVYACLVWLIQHSIISKRIESDNSS